MLPGLTSVGALRGASLWAKNGPARHRIRQILRIESLRAHCTQNQWALRNATDGSVNFHASPEGNAPPDGIGSLRWLRVIPRGRGVLLAFHFDVVVMGYALPRTEGGLAAGLEVFAVKRTGGEVTIAFHHYDVV